MRTILCLALLAAVAVFAAEDSAVLDLTESNYADEVAKHDLIMVEFYAPWCGHCKRLAPEYEEAAKQLSGKVAIAKVDCTQHRGVCDMNGVRGFPTIKIFRKETEEPVDYRGERTAEAIVKFMLRYKAPAITAVESAEQLEGVVNGKDLVVVGFGVGDSFTALANELREELTFYSVQDADLTASQSVTAPAVAIYRPFDERKVVFSGDVTDNAAIKQWIKAHSLPLLGPIGPETYTKYVERELPLFWVFVDPTDQAGTESLLATGRVVAKDFVGKVLFVHLDGKRWADHGKMLGLKDTTPGLVLSQLASRSKNFVFPQQTAVTEESMRQFVQDFIDGKLQPSLKSQEPPADNSEPVKVIVGKTFDAIVNDPTKDVLVEFYAPWCGHCKSLAPKYDSLAQEFASVDSVVIAKVDATENDTPAEIEGFPTLLLYKADDKANPVTFQGDRTVEAMAEFIRANAATLKGSKPAAAAAEESAEKSHDEL